ncbi:unnamed protein product [Schistosoma margrebowiei]|uniref:Uncharacterized protein n=1 Tax=Schistosoma margrebowiei TaxID=48269 RepID=A0A3P7ZT92_9TREM|nr:unnamed protein product [Schistosoma margrebowiei]
MQKSVRFLDIHSLHLVLLEVKCLYVPLRNWKDTKQQDNLVSRSLIGLQINLIFVVMN